MDKALEAGARNLRNSIARAEDYAGTLRAEESVKLRPDDWHSVTRLGRELADRVTALAALPATDTSGLVERLRLIGYEATEEAADCIEALKRENAGLEEACDETLAVAVRNKDRAEKAEALVAEAEAVIRPFASLPDFVDTNGWTDDAVVLLKNGRCVLAGVELRDLRAARSYLEGRK